MLRRDKRWLFAGLGVGAALLAAGLFLAHRRGGDGASAGGADGDGERAWRGFAAGSSRGGGATEGGGPGAPAANPAPPPEVDDVMAAWRQAILVHDSDTVVALDQAFANNPPRFGAALAKSARADQDERVRAFSTRVLGKLKDPGLVDLFTELLADGSPFVRQNAAWALGELAARPAGREAAQKTMAELRRLERRDNASDVRAAAGGALKRLQ